MVAIKYCYFLEERGTIFMTSCRADVLSLVTGTPMGSPEIWELYCLLENVPCRGRNSKRLRTTDLVELSIMRSGVHLELSTMLRSCSDQIHTWSCVWIFESFVYVWVDIESFLGNFSKCCCACLSLSFMTKFNHCDTGFLTIWLCKTKTLFSLSHCYCNLQREHKTNLSSHGHCLSVSLPFLYRDINWNGITQNINAEVSKIMLLKLN